MKKKGKKGEKTLTRFLTPFTKKPGRTLCQADREVPRKAKQEMKFGAGSGSMLWAHAQRDSSDKVLPLAAR